tara:strand:+ start:14437 stop:15318 length:882 start_codon:yes stop_codon:yes gene_type:complete
MTSSTIRYKLSYFEQNLSKNNIVLPKDVLERINIISGKVGSPAYNKTPNFSKEKKYKMEEYENIQITKIAKSEDNWNGIIRKHLNKISVNNFDTIKKEISNIITLNKNDIIIFDKITDFIFTIASSNIYYSKLYAELYKYLCSMFEEFKTLIDNKMSNIEIFTKNIEYCDPNTNYDNFCKINKDNEIRRAIMTFYTNLVNLNVVNNDILFELFFYISNKILELIIVEDTNYIVDEYSELLFIITDSHVIMKTNKKWNDIIERVEYIASLKRTDYLSITSKMIFKHMDILDKIN